MDYDELTKIAETDLNASDSKNRQRRNWLKDEEERFFEIWGRDNWRLTRHGKNTVYFAQWAEELKERFGIEIKPEEIQAKVNQTRAKFRSVKKQLDIDKNAVRWKKFDLVDKILNNQYRPDDAEPVPKEALQNNRDVVSEVNNDSVNVPIAPSISQSNVIEQKIIEENNQNMNNNSNINLNPTPSIFNSNEIQPLVDHAGNIQKDFKQEVKLENCQNNYQSYQYEEHEQYDETHREPQLHQLQTPQQQKILELQHQYQQQAPIHIPITHDQHIQQLQQSAYNSTTFSGNQIHMQPTSNTDNSNVTLQNMHSEIQQSRQTQPAVSTPALLTSTMQPRRRRANILVANTSGTDGLEIVYLEEVRKKNRILDEQREIAYKRLELEERKVRLMEEFFPKCLEMQGEILKKLNNV